MFKQSPRRFLYKGHAVGVSGTFTKPHAEHLEAQASCALSVHGGKSSARVDNFNHRDIVSFRAAYSQVLGTPDPAGGSWNSLVTATVEGLNIHNVVTCDRIVARLASHHYADGREASIVTLGSHFENLKIAGQTVNYEPDGQLLREWDTMSKARDGCLGRTALALAPNAPRIHTSIMKNVACPGGVEVKDNAVYFAEFGIIYLGEIMICDGERRLTMMRIEFGCEVEGDGTFSDVAGNGLPSPPLP